MAKADVTKECLKTNFHLSSVLLSKLCVHYANGFDNLESVYFFYSNPVFAYVLKSPSLLGSAVLVPSVNIVGCDEVFIVGR
jgi:hypothetical protein